MNSRISNDSSTEKIQETKPTGNKFRTLNQIKNK